MFNVTQSVAVCIINKHVYILAFLKIKSVDCNLYCRM